MKADTKPKTPRSVNVRFNPKAFAVLERFDSEPRYIRRNAFICECIIAGEKMLNRKNGKASPA
jgi:hypothetical protein